MTVFSRKSVVAATCCLILPFAFMLAWQEYFIRTHYWLGGFMVLIDKDKVSDTKSFDEASDSNLIILGSSRAKESVNPRVLMDKLPSAGKIYNLANHSSSSADQVHFLNTALSGSIKKPESNILMDYFKIHPDSLLITVEPLHFCTNKVMYAKTTRSAEKEDSAFSTIGKFFQPVRDINARCQKWISERTGNTIYSVFESSSPPQRRKLSAWYKMLICSKGRFKETGSLFPSLWDAYMFVIVERNRWWYTGVVDEARGYEGHRLFLRNGDVRLRTKAFEAHRNVYKTSIFPYYSEKYFDQFEKDLGSLAAKGIRLVMLRLPIDRLLYREEMEHIPGFNGSMENISRNLGIPYVNMNENYDEITHDPLFFTDGSHMEHERTSVFNIRLSEILSPLLSGTSETK